MDPRVVVSTTSALSWTLLGPFLTNCLPEGPEFHVLSTFEERVQKATKEFNRVRYAPKMLQEGCTRGPKGWTRVPSIPGHSRSSFWSLCGAFRPFVQLCSRVRHVKHHRPWTGCRAFAKQQGPTEHPPEMCFRPVSPIPQGSIVCCSRSQLPTESLPH